MTDTTLATWSGSPHHFEGRNGYRVTHITLHVMGGYLAGTDATFKAPTPVSAHYGVGSTGAIHQYVSERDGSFSDGDYASNNSTISIEHEGGIPAAIMTQACIASSARLCADIAHRYGWSRLWHDGRNGNVWLHREIPGTDHTQCPDLAPNGLPYQQVIDMANQLLTGDGNVSSQDLYETKGNDGRNVFDGIIQTRNELKDRASDALIQTRGNDGRNVLDSVIQARYDIANLRILVTAQGAAIESLCKAIGTDPTNVAKTIQDEVKAKLNALDIRIHAEG